MAQNTSKSLSSPIENNTDKVRQMYDASDYKHLRIAPYEVMLSLAVIYMYAKHHAAIDSFDEIHESIAATNYYKFSLNASGKYVNPNSILKKHQSSNDYWQENNGLSKIEINYLEPSVVLSFNGRHNHIIGGLGIDAVKFNDPS